ncbi:hypothetical protein [Dickeya chrysanthemi]|uniref:Uncharacterized protein n=1 Tax=Dickeya chrysanthemi TaxID=556 RepID=A0ABU8JN25_DICCH|nr:hypothetical protein [Dickeya chrysanthemi]MCA7009093.1 hypothetical protein [Dickeya chrysanthemi]
MELLQSITKILSEYYHLFTVIIGAMALVIIVIRWWEEVSYFFLNFMSSLPVMGYIARFSRSYEPRRKGAGGVEWYPAEEAICAKYWQYYRSSTLDADFYLRCVNYLNKVDERGRKPTSMLLWFGSIILVLLEAFIFALVLAPFIAYNITPEQAEISATVVSVLIGVILVPATHLMGSELHKNTLLKKIRYWYLEARLKNGAVDLSKNHEISLENTRLDDNEPNYIQMLNRVTHNVHVKPQYWSTIIALFLIAFFAFGAYFVRSATLDKLQTEEINNPYYSQSLNGSVDSPFDIPKGAKDDNDKANRKALDEIGKYQVFASKLAFVILSVIFVGVQIIGIMIGLHRSFAGIESRSAAQYIGNFSSSEEFAAWHAMRRERVERDAQEKLTALQNKIAMRHSIAGSEEKSALPTFDEYIKMKVKTKILSTDFDKEGLYKNQYKTITPQSVSEKSNTPEPEKLEKSLEGTSDNVDDERQRILALGDLTSLSPEELELIAEDQSLSLEALQKRQRVQLALKKARDGEGV